jgi:hypothetical protein
LTALPALTAQAATTVNFYVSPTGSDGNSGTSAASPFATLARAQTAVRGALGSSAPVTVNLAGGDYQLSSPLTLTPADSGSPGAPVTWQAEPGTFPVISGGVPITGWKVADAGKNIWSAPAPSSLATRQLYVDGTRAPRATGSLPVKVTQTSTGYTTASGDPMAGWRNPSGIEFVYKGGLGAWTEPRCPVASISSTTITMAQPCWNNSTKRVLRTDGSGRTYELVGRQSITESPTSVENAYELLTTGHWYLDPTAHQVYYIPRSGENLQSEDVEAAALPTLLTAVGTQIAAVHDIAFRGLQFSYATDTDTSSPEGFSEIQATYTITGTHGYAAQGLCTFVPGGSCPYGNWTKMPGNVSLAYDRDVTFDHDYFVHLGAAGLDLGDGSQSDTITGCVFTDISGNGVDLGGVDVNEPANAAQHTSGDTIADNHFYNTSVEYQGGVAIDIGYVESATVAHNQLDHLPYTGISVGWGGWPDKVKLPAEPNYSNHNLFSDNLIFNHMSVLADGGAIYTNGITGSSLTTGEHITGTLVHDQVSPTGHGIYTDNGSSYITITGNGEYNIAATVWGSKHTNYTLNNGTYDPLDIEGNYWTNGPAPYNAKAVLIKNNTNITSASQIPSSITANAGLESGFRSILSWQPAR